MPLKPTIRYTTEDRTPATLPNEPCPRCQGSMMLDFDFKAGYYRSCTNCGHIKYLQRPALKSSQL